MIFYIKEILELRKKIFELKKAIKESEKEKIKFKDLFHRTQYKIRKMEKTIENLLG